MKEKTHFYILLCLVLFGMTRLRAQNPTPESMVLISGGQYVIEESLDEDSLSLITVEIQIDSFYMDKYEVTNAEYYKFCKETGHRLPFFWEKEGFNCGSKFPNHPVVGVSNGDASKYAKWAGKRLPTEAEWEYAGHGGLDSIFPGGNNMDSTLCNYGRYYKETLPVGSFQPNGFGLYDFSGNVWEWTSEKSELKLKRKFKKNEYQDFVSDRYRLIKGGGWYSGKMCTSVNSQKTLPRGWFDFAVGFRCARDLHPKRE